MRRSATPNIFRRTLVKVLYTGPENDHTIWDKRPYEVWRRGKVLSTTKSFEEAIAVATRSGFDMHVRDVNADRTRILWEGPLNPRRQAKRDRGQRPAEFARRWRLENEARVSLRVDR
jgi:hypothetical protein